MSDQTLTSRPTGAPSGRLASHWRTLPAGRRVQAICVAVIVMILMLFMAMPSGKAVLQITINTSMPGELQVYFEQGSGFSEDRSSKQQFAAGESLLTFLLPPGKTRSFRLDPPANLADFRIDRIGLAASATGTTGLPLSGGTLQAIAQIDTMEQQADGSTMFRLAADASDAQILFTPANISPFLDQQHSAFELLGWLLIALCAVIALGLWLGERHGHVALATVALGLIIAMACFATTSRSVSPDERLHEADARYFTVHWSPPRIDSEAMLPSYNASPYGVSYLSEWNVTYLLAGKFSNLGNRLGIDDRIGFRLYQAGMFAGILCLVLLLRIPRTAAIPLLITPQIWYLFSYMNGDALPLAASLLASALMFAPGSKLTSFIRRSAPIDPSMLVHVATFIICFAVLVVSKRNYWPVAAFLAVAAAIVPLQMSLRTVAAASVLLLLAIVGAAGGGALASTYGNGITILAAGIALLCTAILAHWALGRSRSMDARRNALRYAGVFITAAFLTSPWIVQDYRVNGGNSGKHAQVEAMREAHAAAAFKPSNTSPSGGIRIRDQGYNLGQMLSPPLQWQTSTFKSFFGVYGYMQYYATDTYYRVIAGCAMLLVILAIGSTLLVDPQGKSYLILAACSAFALIAASFLHSWTYDFQAQGRYIIGCTVLAMPFMFQLRMSNRVYVAANILVAALFLLGVYSFTQIGLPPLRG